MKNLRRKRLLELLQGQRFNNDRAKFLRASGLSKGRLTQLLDPDEAFGDVAARNLCEALGLPAGWFEVVSAPICAFENEQQSTYTVQEPPAVYYGAKQTDSQSALAELRQHLRSLAPVDREALKIYMAALITDPDSDVAAERIRHILEPPTASQDTPETGAQRTA